MEPILIDLSSEQMTGIIIVFTVIGIPVLCGTFIMLACLSHWRGGWKKGKSTVEETKIIQEMHRGLEKMESRIESLETILLGKECSMKEKNPDNEATKR